MPAVKRVLVVGAGVCGTVLAIALKQQGVEVDILELYDEVLGVGVEFSGNTMRALEQIGLIDDFIAEGQPYSRMNVHDSAGNLLIGYDFSRAASPQYPACVAILRPKFAGATRRRAAQLGIPLRIGMTVTELVNEPDGVRVTLNDGSQDRYDVVVAADGAMSDMRTLLHGDRFRHKPLGQTVLRCYLPRLPEIKDELNAYGGRNVVTLVPLSRDSMYFPLSIPMDPERRFEEHELVPTVLKELEEFTAPIFDTRKPSRKKRDPSSTGSQNTSATGASSAATAPATSEPKRVPRSTSGTSAPASPRRCATAARVSSTRSGNVVASGSPSLLPAPR